MADMKSEASVGTDATGGSVAAIGGGVSSIAVDAATIIFDDTSKSGAVLDAIEKAKVQILDFYANKSS